MTLTRSNGQQKQKRPGIETGCHASYSDNSLLQVKRRKIRREHQPGGTLDPAIGQLFPIHLQETHFTRYHASIHAFHALPESHTAATLSS